MLLITNPSNNTYSVINDNAYGTYIKIKQLSDNYVLEVIETTDSIAASGTLSITLEDGMYVFDEYRTSDDTYLGSYIIPVFVAIIAGLNSSGRYLIEQMACTTYACDCGYLFDANAHLQHCYLMGQHISFSYLALMNSVLTNSFMFTVLTADLNNSIITLGKWLDAATDHFTYLNKHYGIS